jgi:hypothetical protein
VNGSPEAAIGATAAKAHFVRDAVIQHAKMLRSWANVCFDGLHRSMLIR